MASLMYAVLVKAFDIVLFFAKRIRHFLFNTNSVEDEPYKVIVDKILILGCEHQRRLLTSRSNSANTEINQLIGLIIQHSRSLLPKVEFVRVRAPEYDFESPHNGFRSFISLAEKAAKIIFKLLQKKSTDLAKLRQLAEMQKFLDLLFDRLLDLLKNNAESDLLSKHSLTVAELARVFGSFNTSCFYGHFLGIHFNGTLAFLFKLLFGWLYKEVNEEKRGQIMMRRIRHMDIDEIRSFINIANSRMFTLVYKILKPMAYARDFDVIVPGLDPPIKCRLISSVRRKGVMGGSMPLAKGIIIQVHGGGFVAVNAKSQESFLRDWANFLQIPILSVDYALAPEYPFPAALNQVFSVYQFVRDNAATLGCDGKKIIMAGDSAGSILILGTTYLCIERGIPVPHGLSLTCLPMTLSLKISPSRHFGVIDPLFSIPFILHCFQAYLTGHFTPKENSMSDECLFCDNPRDLAHKEFVSTLHPNLEVPDSPYLQLDTAGDEVLRKLPPIAMCSTNVDLMLDDMIMFAKKLRKLGNHVTLDVAEGLPHGFLTLSLWHPPANVASMLCAKRIASLLSL